MHMQIQEQIELQEPAVQRLSTFVAVLNPSEGGSKRRKSDAFIQLELMLRSLGDRWAAICDWAEKRAKALDGIVELLEQYQTSSGHLTYWLQNRHAEMQKFRSVHHLESEAEIDEQKFLIRKMEQDLSSEHPAFVELSRQSTELAERFRQGGNDLALENIHKQLSLITQDWENIVTRLEEQWEMLIRTGKTIPEKSRRSSSTQRDSTKNGKSDKPRKNSTSSSDVPERKQSSEKSKNGSTSTSPRPAGDELLPEKRAPDEKSIVSDFLREVDELENRIQPLIRWCQLVGDENQALRQRTAMCSSKLEEIRELEVERSVSHLQVRLEQIHKHISDVGNLHAVNERHDKFMHRWSLVVDKISKMIASLSSPTKRLSREQLLSNRMEPRNESEAILDRISDWLRSANKTLDELQQIETNADRKKRVVQIAQQLGEHQTHVSYIRRNAARSEPKLLDQISSIEEKFQQLLLKIEQLHQSPKITIQFSADSLKTKPETSISQTAPKSPPIENLVTEAEELKQKLITEQQKILHEHEISLERTKQVLQDSEAEQWIEWLKRIEVKKAKGYYQAKSLILGTTNPNR